jgi:5-methylcytosine-specific restriction endonuclease McrA
MAKPMYGAAWQRVRRAVLERDEFRCQLRRPGCTLDATEVDHIVSVADGGAWYDPENLRAACRWCNSSRGGAVGGSKPSVRRPSREW